MQPYFAPYLGYFQLMHAVDEFIIYDDVEYTKKGWINRNRILVNGSDELITLPLQKDSDYALIGNRFLADTWQTERIKILNKIRESYRKAPFFNVFFPILETILYFEDRNLFRFLQYSIAAFNQYIGLTTPVVVSSTIEIDHGLKGKQRVIRMCQARGCSVYINPIGGIDLYDKNEFRMHEIDLRFLRMKPVTYHQFGDVFIPSLSIIDVLMFNSREDVALLLEKFDLE